MSRSITRRKTGKSFHYFDGDTKITDTAVLDRITALAIPPAWRSVTIAASPHTKIQASGIDKAGRQQSIYSLAYRAKAEAAKFQRIVSFAHQLPTLRRQVDKDLTRRRLSKEKVLACIVTLMDQAYFRVGNDTYARDHQTYGITTLRSKHATITTTSVTFDFVGKSGKKHHKTIADRKLARIVRQLDELPGYELFQYIDSDGDRHRIHAADVNAYIKACMGEDFTAKDFRTWGGTMLATTALAAERPNTKQPARQKQINACVKQVARRLGNTPAVARQSYIDPRIIEAYLHTDTIHTVWQTMSTMKPNKYLKAEEQCVLSLLTELEDIK